MDKVTVKNAKELAKTVKGKAGIIVIEGEFRKAALHLEPRNGCFVGSISTARFTTSQE